MSGTGYNDNALQDLDHEAPGARDLAVPNVVVLGRGRCEVGPEDASWPGPCIPVGIRLEKAEVGPASGSTWRLPHLATLIEQGDSSLVGSMLTMEALWWY